jgi:hypothetical protein
MKPAFFHRDCQKLEEFGILLPFSINVFGSGDEQLMEAHENIRENRGNSGAVLQQNPGHFLKKKLSKFREWKKKFLNKLNLGTFGNSKMSGECCKFLILHIVSGEVGQEIQGNYDLKLL